MAFVKNTTVSDLIGILERLPPSASVVPVSVVVSAELNGHYTTTLELRIFGKKVDWFDEIAHDTPAIPRIEDKAPTTFVDEYRRRKMLT
jgi:hypothetical protein